MSTIKEIRTRCLEEADLYLNKGMTVAEISKKTGRTPSMIYKDFIRLKSSDEVLYIMLREKMDTRVTHAKITKYIIEERPRKKQQIADYFNKPYKYLEYYFKVLADTNPEKYVEVQKVLSKDKRYLEIAEYVMRDEPKSISEISIKFGLSNSTIRRDLEKLKQENLEMYNKVIGIIKSKKQ